MFDPLQVRPLRDQVLVQVLLEDLRRESGLVIPENVKHPSVQGRVVACGPSVSTDVQPGYHVLFEHVQETQLIPDPADPETEYLLMSESDVIGVFPEESDADSR